MAVGREEFVRGVELDGEGGEVVMVGTDAVVIIGVAVVVMTGGAVVTPGPEPTDEPVTVVTVAYRVTAVGVAPVTPPTDPRVELSTPDSSGSGVGSGSAPGVVEAGGSGVTGVQTALSGMPICWTEVETERPSRHRAIRRLPARRKVRRPARSTRSRAHIVETTYKQTGRQRSEYVKQMQPET